jgi:hypothetical protein
MNQESTMSKQSTHFLVVNPYLTYLSFAQRLTPQMYANFVTEMQQIEGVLEEVVIVPYTQKLQRTLKAQKSLYYSQTDYVPVLYLQ